MPRRPARKKPPPARKGVRPPKAYARAGVDIDLAERALRSVKGEIKRASRPEVLGGIGGFGGLFDISRLGIKRPVLVGSTDGVGTKLKVAQLAGDHRGVGHDIVNHCLNDIAVMGAEPLFFLDYIGTGKLDPAVYRAVVSGIARGCRAANCALIGGETAEMPGLYQGSDYDLVGTVVGVVDRPKILTGEAARPGDRLVGIASNGLHTNGYSLARALLFDRAGLAPGDPLEGGRGTTVGRALLRPHTNYSAPLGALRAEFNRGSRADRRRGNAIFGAAHITGGGFPGNLPRVLPAGCGALVDVARWPRPPIFRALQKAGGGAVDPAEFYEVFNMGIGMVLTVDARRAEEIIDQCRQLGHRAFDIGGLVEGSAGVELRGLGDEAG